MKVALYARISTNDGRQELDNQLDALRSYAGRMSWTVAQEFTDQQSGARNDRPGLVHMLNAAARREFDALLVWDLSRLTRGGPASAFTIIERLNQSGVKFWSFTEEHFRSSGPAGDLLIAIAAYIAHQERETQRNRVKAGIDRRRKEGKKIGPAFCVVDLARVNTLRSSGHSVRQIAKILNTSKSVIQRRLKQLDD